MEKMMDSNRLRLKVAVNMVPVMLLILFYYTHYIEGTYSQFIPLIISIFWAFQGFTIAKPKKVFCRKESIGWGLYFAISFFMVFFGLSSTNLNFLIIRIPIYFIPIIGYFIVRYYNPKEKLFVLTAFAVIFLANLLYNIYISFILPEVFVNLDNSLEGQELETRYNIASTSFIAVSLWLIGTLSIVIANIRSKILACFCLIVIAMSGYYMLFVNSRGTATLLLALMLLLFVLSTKAPNKGNSQKVYYIVAFILLFIAFIVLFVPFVSFVIDKIEDVRLKDRLEDVMAFQKSGGDANKLSSGGSMGERIKLAQTSLNTFFSSPVNMLIGIGDHTQGFGGNLVKSGIGSHSEFIDVLARYGIIGATVFIYILREYYKILFSLSNRQNIKKYLFWIFVIYILYGFLNNVFQPIMEIYIFMILPIIVSLLDLKLNTYKSCQI